MLNKKWPWLKSLAKVFREQWIQQLKKGTPKSHSDPYMSKVRVCSNKQSIWIRSFNDPLCFDILSNTQLVMLCNRICHGSWRRALLWQSFCWTSVKGLYVGSYLLLTSKAVMEEEEYDCNVYCWKPCSPFDILSTVEWVTKQIDSKMVHDYCYCPDFPSNFALLSTSVANLELPLCGVEDTTESLKTTIESNGWKHCFRKPFSKKN